MAKAVASKGVGLHSLSTMQQNLGWRLYAGTMQHTLRACESTAGCADACQTAACLRVCALMHDVLQRMYI